MQSFLADLMILIGSAFMLVTAIGIWRLPDLNTKMHAATKAATSGCGLILIGAACHLRDVHVTTEIILLLIFVTITNPLSAHLVGRLKYQADEQGVE